MLQFNFLYSLIIQEETIEIKKRQLKNSKTNKARLISDEEIYKVQQQMLKDQAKKKKYKKQGKNH